jgi:hypothetical protein
MVEGLDTVPWVAGIAFVICWFFRLWWVAALITAGVIAMAIQGAGSDLRFDTLLVGGLAVAIPAFSGARKIHAQTQGGSIRSGHASAKWPQILEAAAPPWTTPRLIAMIHDRQRRSGAASRPTPSTPASSRPRRTFHWTHIPWGRLWFSRAFGAKR